MSGLKILASCAALSLFGLAACTFPLADDIHLRGSEGNWLYDTSQYRAVDTAIHDVLVERFQDDAGITSDRWGRGAPRSLGPTVVEHSAYPEKSNHRWVANSDEWPHGLARQRVRVEGRPQISRDGRYEPEFKVFVEIRAEEFPGFNTRTRDWGVNMWHEGSRDTHLETELTNEVNRRLRQWQASGMPDPGSRVQARAADSTHTAGGN